MCIAEHQAVKEGVVTSLQSGFAKHNVKTRVIPALCYETSRIKQTSQLLTQMVVMLLRFMLQLALNLVIWHMPIFAHNVTNKTIAQASYLRVVV